SSDEVLIFPKRSEGKILYFFPGFLCRLAEEVTKKADARNIDGNLLFLLSIFKPKLLIAFYKIF
ncbi:MAG TPA: hypothetical protein VI894_03055, partial [Candidatus Nanoarchaeia archaeon]|nr:hypothetical protein [Candidatus Nanoarchaeia archaeon]